MENSRKIELTEKEYKNLISVEIRAEILKHVVLNEEKYIDKNEIANIMGFEIPKKEGSDPECM